MIKVKKHSLFTQLLLFFLIGMLLTAVLAGLILRQIADRNVLREREILSAGVTADVENSLTEYRAYAWVLDYLIRHSGEELDLEYDSCEKTALKESAFLAAHPGLILTGVTDEQLEALSPEDQKTFAEIVYNHWLLRMNDLKQAYSATYLYCFAVDDRYEEGTFLITASDGSRERGTGPENAFVMGTTVPLTPDQSETFRNLAVVSEHFIYTSELADRYRYLFRIGEMNVISGMSFEVASIREDAEEQLLPNIVYFVLLQFLLAAYCLGYVGHFALRPLNRVRSNVSDYAESKDGVRIRTQLAGIRSRNEIGELASGISDMTREIDDYLEEIRNITAEKERIGAELNVARQIQADMLPNIFPPFPEIGEFNIFASMDPAREVGGDFYDFFLVDDRHVALVMADVSGKGVPAALFMVIAKTMIKNRAMLGGGPAEILRDVNNQLCANNASDYFVTAWLAIIDIKTGEGLAANAGHEHPVLRRADGRFELVVYRHSLALAAMEGISFREHAFRLNPGDRLFVYTDGVPEATGPENELYGTDRMLDSLNRDPDADGEQMLKNLRKDIEVFSSGAEQFDDITMMIFDYEGSGKETAETDETP